jgi:hypothetical protein
LVLLGRPDCHLCEEFEEELRAHAPTVEVERADVDSRADWREQFGRRIPVLLDARGSVICEARFDAAAVAPHLK